jgi:hypothetical protein
MHLEILIEHDMRMCESAVDVMLTWLSRDANLRLVFHPGRRNGAYHVTCTTTHCWMGREAMISNSSDGLLCCPRFSLVMFLAFANGVGNGQAK